MADTIINERIETDLRTKDFYYDLPQELVAQHPAPQRDHSRLMVIHRDSGLVEHRIFNEIGQFLNKGDVLVVNDSKVIPARIFGHVLGREEAGIELLLLRARGLDQWEVLVRPGKRAKIGMELVFGNGELQGVIEQIVQEGNRIVRFTYDHDKYTSLYELLHIIGLMPLPPYITEKQDDIGRYQTVYARTEGSVAAPTAGLHFTDELLKSLQEGGVALARVMLHVGLGTFRPVKETEIRDHVMHTEYIEVTKETADLINEKRAAGGRIICVGTTSCRTLESAADDGGIVHPVAGDTGIFIYPGYRFKATDALITNFHLPESTLLMLVSAFYNREKMLEAYRTAVEQRYRFFSFGDAMIIL